MMYFAKLLFSMLCLLVLVSCSVKVKELEPISSDGYSHIVFSVLTEIPHAKYEVKQLKKEIEDTYRKDKKYRDLRVCLSYTPEAISCKKINKDYHAHLTITIKDLAGIGDAGDVYGDRIEGKGYVKAVVGINDKSGKVFKEYVLESSASPDETELAKGVGEAVRKIAKKAVTISLDDIYSLSNLEKSKTQTQKEI